MNILIIGGTVFLGRALVEAALERGHRLTLFNRGKSNSGLFAEVEQLHGDRKTDLSPLAGRRWDAVIDTCGYVPRVVNLSLTMLAGAVDHYTFVSSLSAYASVARPGVQEDEPVAKMVDETVEVVDGDTYGPLKALCEQAVEQAMPGRALILRPGLIVGPHDPSDRFTYWPHRIAQGGNVLAPGRPDRGVQYIDVRDLAEWTIRMVEQRRTGIFNSNTVPGAVSMKELLECCRSVSGSDAVLQWTSDSFLLEQNVGAWMEMPLWIPESDPESRGFFALSVQRAVEAGLTFRSIEETVRATLDWDNTRADHPWRAGISRDRETELLSKWRAL